MKINESAIPDIKHENLDKTKIELAEVITSSLIPLIQPQISKKIKDLKISKRSLYSKKDIIQKEKNELKNLQHKYERQKKINLLLNRVEQLTTLGLETTLRSELISVLRKINEMPDEKINFYIDETLRIISRKFAKTEKE